MKKQVAWIGKHEMKLNQFGEAFQLGFYTTRAQKAIEFILECVGVNRFSRGGYANRTKYVDRDFDGECYLRPNLWDNEAYCIEGLKETVRIFKERFCTKSAEEALKECVEGDAGMKFHKQRYEDAMTIANELYETEHSDEFKKLVGLQTNPIQQEALSILFDKQNKLVFEISEVDHWKKREELEREWIKLDKQIEKIYKIGGK